MAIRRKTGLSLSLALAFLLTGADQGPGHHFETSTEQGVRVVTNTGGPKYAGELFTYEKILTIDPVEEEALLANPIQFLSDEVGRFYVYDSRLNTILVFDPHGRFLNTIGREGSGPGEFRGGRIMAVRDGTLTFLSRMHLQRFAVDGTLIDIQRLRPEVEQVAFEGYLLRNDNHILIRTENDASRGGLETEIRVILTAPDGAILLDYSGPPVQMQESVTFRSGGQSQTLPFPLLYGPQPSAHYDPAVGLVVSVGDSPDLSVYDQEGRLRRKIHVDLPREPVTSGDRAAASELYARRFASAPEEMRSRMEEIVAQLPFADDKPHWTDFEVDVSGHIWLRMSTPQPYMAAGDLGAPDELGCHLLSPEGEYLGVTRRPNGFSATVSHGRLLVLETNEETGLNVPTVYAIHPAVPGFEYP